MNKFQDRISEIFHEENIEEKLIEPPKPEKPHPITKPPTLPHDDDQPKEDLKKKKDRTSTRKTKKKRARRRKTKRRRKKKKKNKSNIKKKHTKPFSGKFNERKEIEILNCQYFPKIIEYCTIPLLKGQESSTTGHGTKPHPQPAPGATLTSKPGNQGVGGKIPGKGDSGDGSAKQPVRETTTILKRPSIVNYESQTKKPYVYSNDGDGFDKANYYPKLKFEILGQPGPVADKQAAANAKERREAERERIENISAGTTKVEVDVVDPKAKQR